MEEMLLVLWRGKEGIGRLTLPWTSALASSWMPSVNSVTLVPLGGLVHNNSSVSLGSLMTYAEAPRWSAWCDASPSMVVISMDSDGSD
jgi:hypothetical protein